MKRQEGLYDPAIITRTQQYMYDGQRARDACIM